MSKVSVEARELCEPEDQGLERRRSARAQFLVRVDYSTVDEMFSEFTRDINEGGLFIETDNPRPPGTVVSMQFNLPGSDAPIRTEGLVVRVSDGGDGSMPGMGIEFEELEGEARQRIDQLVRTLRTGLPAPADEVSEAVA
ncbi:MAG: TIGR02266 family protein [Myxococcota bacterium]